MSIVTKDESQAVSGETANLAKTKEDIGSLAGTSADDGTVTTWHKPLLGGLLKGIHLRSSVLFRPEFGAPWAVRFDASTGPRLGITERVSVFHIVAQGSCWLSVQDAREPVLLSDGDSVVFTRGDPHTLCDAPGTPAINFSEAAKQRCAPGIHGVFRAGGAGCVTKFVCGGMHFEDAATNPLLAILPSYLHLRASEQSARPCLRLTVKHILAELESDDPRAADIVARLTDILFILAVRSYFEQGSEAAELGWLAAARDRRIGPALALLHGQPHRPWTIESFARHVAMSRFDVRG